MLIVDVCCVCLCSLKALGCECCRQQQKGEAFINAEAVLAHYGGNTDKARQAMVEAEMDGRSGLTTSEEYQLD